MKNKLQILALLFLGSTMCSCQPTTPQIWLEENTNEIALDNDYDFSSIDQAIGDKRIVALGESSHGIGEYFRFKSALVKYLHEEKGFEVIAMEGGLGDITLSYSHIDSFSAKQLRNNSVFGNFRAKEADLLFNYIKLTSTTDTPLYYAGFDSQSSSDFFSKELSQLLKYYDPLFAQNLDKGFSSYYLSFQALQKGDTLDYIHHRDLFIHTAKKSQEILELNHDEMIKKQGITAYDLAVMHKTLEGYHLSVDLPNANRWNLMAKRDSLMFDNLQWLMSVKYPNKKFIVWAHNGHIENKSTENSNIKMMGHFLKEVHQNNYYSIGLFTTKGEAFQHWTKNIIPFNHTDSTFIEKRLFESGKKIAFLNLQKVSQNTNTNWLFEPQYGFEIESNGKISFVPKKRFDGIINFDYSTSPTFE